MGEKPHRGFCFCVFHATNEEDNTCGISCEVEVVVEDGRVVKEDDDDGTKGVGDSCCKLRFFFVVAVVAVVVLFLFLFL